MPKADNEPNRTTPLTPFERGANAALQGSAAALQQTLEAYASHPADRTMTMTQVRRILEHLRLNILDCFIVTSVVTAR